MLSSFQMFILQVASYQLPGSYLAALPMPHLASKVGLANASDPGDCQCLAIVGVHQVRVVASSLSHLKPRWPRATKGNQERPS